MMAKMFYTSEETQQLLNLSEADLRQLTLENRLREFRDGGQVRYKADQVESLRAELGLAGGDQIDLGPSDTGAGMVGLADSRGGTAGGSVISLADSQSRDDTATDLGLSPSMSRVGSGSGINVLGDSGAGADPMAQTSVSPSSGLSGINMDAMGSGSGLLDLSRERDDTSLGAPVIEDIQGGSKTGLSGMGTAIGGAIGGAAGGAALPLPMPSRGAPVYVSAPDAVGSGLGAAALAASVVVLLVGILAVAGAVTGTKTFISDLTAPSNAAATPWYFVFGGGAVAALIFFVVGLVLGKKK